MQTHTKVDFKNVLAGIGAGFLILFLLAFVIARFTKTDGLDASAIRSVESKRTAGSATTALLTFVKIEKPYTGEVFQFAIHDDTNGNDFGTFDLLGDSKDYEQVVIQSNTQYTITETGSSNSKNYDTKIQCSVEAGKNYRDIYGKSVTLNLEPDKGITCVFTNTYCPPGAICRESPNYDS